MVNRGRGRRGRGARGGAGAAGPSGLSRGENWQNHNLNSSMRLDLSREERRQRRIQELRMHGVPEQELKVRYEVPVGKRGQGDVIDPLNTAASAEITEWGGHRRNYYYLLIFGNGTVQAQGEMVGIRNVIDNKIKPNLRRIYDQILEAGGEPVFPPRFFSIPLENLQVPPLPPTGNQ